MERAQGPVIIDNTNMQSWEMRPYVAMVSSFSLSFFPAHTDTVLSLSPKCCRVFVVCSECYICVRP